MTKFLTLNQAAIYDKANGFINHFLMKCFDVFVTDKMNNFNLLFEIISVIFTDKTNKLYFPMSVFVTDKTNICKSHLRHGYGMVMV
jgi:hypothetical protein